MMRRFGDGMAAAVNAHAESVWEALASRRPAPTIPTTPGLYVVRMNNPSEGYHASAVFALSLTGYWSMDHTHRLTLEELAGILSGRQLVQLIPRTDGDL